MGKTKKEALGNWNVVYCFILKVCEQPKLIAKHIAFKKECAHL
jgi:hypothetical protein